MQSTVTALLWGLINLGHSRGGLEERGLLEKGAYSQDQTTRIPSDSHSLVLTCIWWIQHITLRIRYLSLIQFLSQTTSKLTSKLV